MVRITVWAAMAFAGCVLGAALEGRDFIEADLASYEAREERWPYGPFKTQGRDIVNSRGEKITWAGINWPLSGKLSPNQARTAAHPSQEKPWSPKD